MACEGSISPLEIENMTHTCMRGFPPRQVLPRYMDPMEIVQVCKSDNNNSLHSSYCFMTAGGLLRTFSH